MLFIFDDVWNQKFFQFLTFAKKSIVTSRCDIEDNDNQYRRIPAMVRDLIHVYIYIISLGEPVNSFSNDLNIIS